MQINLIELSGYVASALVFLTFYMKTMIPLRIIAILSNVAFITDSANIFTPSSFCMRSYCRFGFSRCGP